MDTIPFIFFTADDEKDVVVLGDGTFSEQQQQKKDGEDDGGLINPERTSLKKIVNGDDDVKNHDWKEHAIAYVKGGAVKEGQLNNVSVVAEPSIPIDVLLHILFVVGIYPCAKGQVYKNNKTTDAIERRVAAYFGSNVWLVFVDAVLFSADEIGTNTKTFNPQKMLETLRDNRVLAAICFHVCAINCALGRKTLSVRVSSNSRCAL